MKLRLPSLFITNVKDDLFGEPLEIKSYELNEDEKDKQVIENLQVSKLPIGIINIQKWKELKNLLLSSYAHENMVIKIHKNPKLEKVILPDLEPEQIVKGNFSIEINNLNTQNLIVKT